VGVQQGEIDYWVDYYNDALGFRQSMEEDIATEYSAMNSKVVQKPLRSHNNCNRRACSGKRKSPIDEYLTYYGGSGVHHVALLSKDIIETVGTLRINGVEFTSTPSAYYDPLEARIGRISEDMEALRRFNIFG